MSIHEIKQEILSELAIAKQFAAQIDFEQVKSGEWFFILFKASCPNLSN